MKAGYLNHQQYDMATNSIETNRDFRVAGFWTFRHRAKSVVDRKSSIFFPGNFREIKGAPCVLSALHPFEHQMCSTFTYIDAKKTSTVHGSVNILLFPWGSIIWVFLEFILSIQMVGLKLGELGALEFSCEMSHFWCG